MPKPTELVAEVTINGKTQRAFLDLTVREDEHTGLPTNVVMTVQPIESGSDPIEIALSFTPFQIASNTLQNAAQNKVQARRKAQTGDSQ